MLSVKWQLAEVSSFVSHYFGILIHTLITSCLISYNLLSSNWYQKQEQFLQINFKILLYVFKCFMVLPLFTWLTRSIVLPPLRHSGWQVNLCWSSPHLGGSWEATAPSQLLCQGCGIPYTSGSLTHFLSAASQKLISFLWLFSVAGEAAVYCFPLFLFVSLDICLF